MKRALAVGIDHYPTMTNLGGCVADAEAVAELLRRNDDGSRNFTVQVLLGTATNPGGVTRGLLRDELGRLFANSRDHDLLFYFAGHGGQTAWGADLMTQDGTHNSPGVSMNDLITLANGSAARSATIILDCCYSGDVGNVAALQPLSIAEQFRHGVAVLRENVVVMTASRPTEPVGEARGHGVFTRVLLAGLEGGATDHLGRITGLGLYEFVSAAFDAWAQRPLLKAHLTEPTVLREGRPWLDVELLRELPQHFPKAKARVRLSPDHEGEGRPFPPGLTGTAEQQQFDYFGRLRNANLLTTDEGRALYWVALEGGEVYLTPIGQYFWDLARRDAL
ncbi:caspase family protein [Cryptosporangium phraense]|uniref:Peptidase C14 caspase domain-containing protein n=1 Tax=Cryptosporangium phraense TaxID=2593070 RepID=A0A545AV53_9ACTN|nr:caspase family protein [Cryptosporangium phraense]TQS45210.1 hypothetical protein FL583_08895 [Cryptosporangium phraense]